ncbi:hypothetical protein [Rhodobacter capsulatus]|uniref:hypothetical protein n=1 Tax=Rhodobacter capsulatus TaxID=1061 RepID=UPI00402700D0
MTAATPFPGNDIPLPQPKHDLRVSFGVSLDFLQDAQTALDNLPRKLASFAEYLEVLRELANARRSEIEPARLSAAFDVGAAALRSMIDSEAQVLGEVLDLLDDAQNISRAA